MRVGQYVHVWKALPPLLPPLPLPPPAPVPVLTSRADVSMLHHRNTLLIRLRKMRRTWPHNCDLQPVLLVRRLLPQRRLHP